MMLEPVIGSMPWRVGVSMSCELHRGRMAWCEENLGPYVVPKRGFVWRPPGLISGIADRDLDVWRFRERGHAVMFDMVWG